MSKTKYIFVSGGVISGLGKGITAASLGLLLESAGYKTSIIKADMYLNQDAGTMNPLEHGEVFVADDGTESDQDLGHYERFMNKNLSRYNYFSMGQVYAEVLRKERSLEYGGKCVEGHVHIPEEIIKRINNTAKIDKCDFLIIEVGGTVGEYQNMMFFESIRRLKQEMPERVALMHVVYLPIPPFLGEMKSKPAQASIYELYRLGLQPDFVVCRGQEKIDEKRRRTLAFNTGVCEDCIFNNADVDTIYRTPMIFKDQQMEVKVLKKFKLKPKKKDLNEWQRMLVKINSSKKEVKIAIMGKYFTSGNFKLEDSYVCVIEAIKHAAWFLGRKPAIQWFDVENFKEAELAKFDGVIVPQGWGSRGVEGKIKAVQYAREHKVPYLGLCFGMQMAVIEYARHVAKLTDANSTEVNPKTKFPVIHVMEDQKEYLAKNQYGGTIRLGAWPCAIKPGTILAKAYGKATVSERHRHRYEFNNDYKQILERNGLVISGTSPDGKLVEAVELPKDVHPFFVGTQFHPEYKSRPLSPHPIFIEFLKACQK